jgi:hypothetical protein
VHPVWFFVSIRLAKLPGFRLDFHFLGLGGGDALSIAVTLFNRGQRLRSAVLYGSAQSLDARDEGAIAAFSMQTLVLYQLVTRNIQTFLFRGAGGVTVPGVSPSVNLISQGANATQSRRLTRTVFWLLDNHYPPDAIDDALWLRINALLNKETYSVKQLRWLLERRV